MKTTAIIQENPNYVRVNGAIINRNKKDYELALLRNKDKNRINNIETKLNELDLKYTNIEDKLNTLINLLQTR